MVQLMQKLGNNLAKISNLVNSKLFILAIIATGIMAIPTTIDVALGYFMRSSVPGAIEIVEYLELIMIFACLGYVNDKRGHIYVEMFFEKFSPAIQSIIKIVICGSATVIFAIMTWRLYALGMDKIASSEVSFALNLPVGVFVLFASFGSLTATLSFLAEFIQHVARLLEDKKYLHLVIAFVLFALMLYLPELVKASPIAQDKLLLGVLAMAFLMFLLMIGAPIGVAMLGVGFAGMYIIYPMAKPALAMLGIGPFSTASSYIYTVVPMFILMGELAMYSGISKDLFNTANVWLGKLPGGLAVASVTGCAGFSAVSGDSMATAVTMASVALPEMEKKHYDSGFACATLAAGGTLGILIPPSTGFIFYSLVTEVSIGKLFLAGIVPGLVLTGLFILVILSFARKHPELAPRGESSTWSEKFTSLKGVIAMIALIGLVLGGILLGWFNPNQGGAIGVVGTFIYAIVRRRLSWVDFVSALKSTTIVTTKLMMILIGVGLLGNFFAATRLPFELADLVTGIGTNKYVIFMAVIVLYIVLGCMMNVIPMILLTLPAIYPTILALGFDPIWFGVVIVILMEMGQITPPVGINVFALSTVAVNVPMASVFKRIIPFFLAMLFMVVILLVFPSLATFLPNLLF